MKTITEFPGSSLLNALKTRQELLTAGKTAEELPAAMGEALKLEGDKLNLLLGVLEVVEKKSKDLKRVVVLSLQEGENPPRGTEQKGEHYFTIEYFPPMPGQQLGRPGKGRGDRDHKGGRKERGGKRDGRKPRGGGRDEASRGAGRGPGGPSAIRTAGEGPGPAGERRPPRRGRGPRTATPGTPVTVFQSVSKGIITPKTTPKIGPTKATGVITPRVAPQQIASQAAKETSPSPEEAASGKEGV